MPPIIVNYPVRMAKANIVVPSWYSEKTIEALQHSGAIHVTESGRGIEEYVKLYDRVKKLISTVNNIIQYAKGRSVEVSLTLSEISEFSIDRIEDEVTSLQKKINALNDSINEHKHRLEQLQTIRRYISVFDPSTPLDQIYFRGRFLTVLTVYGTHDQFESLNKLCISYNIEHYVLEQHVLEHHLVENIVFIGEFKRVLGIVEECGLQVLDISEFVEKARSIGELISILDSTIIELNEKIQALINELNKIIEDNLEYLAKYLVYLENIYGRLDALMKIYGSKYLVLVNGWIPRGKVKDVERILSEQDIPFYAEYVEPVKGRDEPPTLLENPPVIRWFEPIVKFMGMPRYWEWDPTPIIAYSFMLFYGLMLGDMGYAVAIVLAALLILDRLVEDPGNRDYQFFKKGLIVSSIVGFIIGFLGGTIFGIQLFTITSVFSNPIRFLILAIIIGLIHVNIGHALTLIKALREHSTGEVLSEAGLFIAEAFGIPYIVYTMLKTPVPFIPGYMYQYLLWGALAGIVVIIIGMIKTMGSLGLILWLFQVTGILGDTLSYSRIAGVGLATVYLAQSFNQIALLAYHGVASGVLGGVAGSVVGGVIAAIILVMGHLLNTALSALGGFIHSLRLCFVEFLSKFYEGTGYPFTPLKIITRRRIIIS